MASEVEQVRNLEIQIGDPWRVREQHGESIAALERAHYGRVFGTIHEFDLNEIAAVEQTDSWDNPNRAQGDSLRSNPEVVIATQDGELAGFAYLADDTSSAKDGAIGVIEKRTKMWFSKLGARYTWIRELIARGDDAHQAVVYDAILYAALHLRRDDQKVTLYPDVREIMLARYAESRGFRPGEEIPRKPVAAGSIHHWQLRRYQADSGETIKEQIKKERSAVFIANVLTKLTD